MFKFFYLLQKIRYGKYFVWLIFVALCNYENFLTTKISRFMVYKYYYQSDTRCLLQINALPVLPSSYMGKLPTLQSEHLLEQLACDVCVDLHVYKSRFEALGKQSSVSNSSFVVCFQLCDWINQLQPAILGPQADLTGIRAAEFFLPIVLPGNVPKVWMATCVARTHGTTLMSTRCLVIRSFLLTSRLIQCQ